MSQCYVTWEVISFGQNWMQAYLILKYFELSLNDVSKKKKIIDSLAAHQKQSSWQSSFSYISELLPFSVSEHVFTFHDF